MKLLILIPLVLTSCTNPADTARLSKIVDTALTLAVRRGVISELDAADVREAKELTLQPVELSGK